MRSVQVGARMRIFVPAALALCVLALAALVPRAMAAGEIKSFSFEPTTTQAGGHPDISANVGLGSGPTETAERLSFDWPPGLNFFFPAVPTCSSADFGTGECSSTSQLGLATIWEADEMTEVVLGTVPVFALKPVPGNLARIGFVIPGVDQPIYGDIHQHDSTEYLTSLTLAEFPQTAPLASMDLTLWGVPSDVSHNPDRFPKGTNGCPGLADTSCNGPPVPSNLPANPQIESPTTCPPVHTTAKATLGTYEDAGQLDTETAQFPEMTGCTQLGFNPAAFPVLTTAEARSPTGLDLQLDVPQMQSSTVPSPSELRAAETVFEGGVMLGSGPESMNSCPQNDIGSFDQFGTSLCPSDTQLGTAAVDIAGFPSPISGGIYLAGEFEGGYFAYLLASGSEYHVVLPVFIEEDPETGLAVIGFESLPQIPIEVLTLHFSAALETLETVNECGSFQTKTYFEPWDSAIAIQFAINEFVLNSGPGGTPCPGPASNVAVSLTPSAIPANGVSVTTARAHVTDANGGPAIGDHVEFRSTDAGQRIGPVTETADGIYRATITASTTAGSVTITAVDTSVTPNVSGSATLVQTGGPPLVRAAPVTKITRHPRHRSRNRRPIFAFSSSVPGSTFSCSVDNKHYRPCASPLRLKNLPPGAHRFRVLAVSPVGEKGKPVAFHFRVLKRTKSAGRSR
jgi:Invasin, domain 3